MLQKTWIRVFIWFIATFFFFLTSAVLISIFKPGPTEAEVMKFMMAMMQSMDSSMMGVAMNIKSDSILGSIITLSAQMIVPLIIASVVIGFIIRIKQWRDTNDL